MSNFWAPNFDLLTVDSLARTVDVGPSMGDLDTEEMFLNFYLHASISSYAYPARRP